MNEEKTHTETNVIELYKEAVERLQAAAEESQKNISVDLPVMLLNCQLCGELVNKIRNLDVQPIRKAALEQLSIMLSHHEAVIKAKMSHLDDPQDSSSAKENVKSYLANLHYPGSPKNWKRSRKLAIEDTIIAKGQVKFADVAGLSEAKQALKEAIITPIHFPHLFTGGRKPWKRILLYGPPGTGKSRLAQAVSSEINSTFYCVSSSDLVSSWVGESEKLIKELFLHATAQEGRSVIFIDELDSICRRRSSAEEEYTRRIKTELLKQMEGADNGEQSDRIFLLCATNCPWELDPAFLRRFQKRIYIPLPDREARLSLFKIHSKDNTMHMSGEEWDDMSEKTEGYSGSDIATLTLGALFEPIRDLQNATHWKNTPDGKLIPCNSEDADALSAVMSELPPDKVAPRPVTFDDFLKSISVHRKTVSPEELTKFQQFTDDFGQNG